MKLPENMEFVCKDAGPSEWKYDPEGKRYYRVYENTKEYKAISGKYLPDPEIVLAERAKKFMRKGMNIHSLECAPATKALFNHWTEVSSTLRIGTHHS
jgi:hypothetical protein